MNTRPSPLSPTTIHIYLLHLADAIFNYSLKSYGSIPEPSFGSLPAVNTESTPNDRITTLSYLDSTVRWGPMVRVWLRERGRTAKVDPSESPELNLSRLDE